jgi:BMFP domain-containing protein YqiC
MTWSTKEREEFKALKSIVANLEEELTVLSHKVTAINNYLSKEKR